MTEHILGFDPLAGTLPYWAAGVAAAVFVAVGVIAFRRAAGTGIFPVALRYTVILIGALVVLTFLDRATMRDRHAERRALESRAVELTARAVTPGSALACLDAGAGDEVERACEKVLFASPEAVAAAVSYVGARFVWLGDALDYAQHDTAYATMLGGARKTLEADRFGILAHVLTTRDGCTADNCPALKRLGDASRVQKNMRERTYAVQVARYAPVWASRPAPAPGDDKPSAALSGNNATASVASAAGEVPPNKSSLPNIDFPSASSIPAVNIMNTEGAPASAAAPAMPAPAAPPPPAAASKPATASAAPPTPPRRPPQPARRAAPAAEQQPGAPVQIAPITPTPFDNAGQAAAAGQ